MCEFCQGYRQAARDLSKAERTGTPQATPCPYRDSAQAMTWLQGYMAYLKASRALGAALDDPTPQERWKYGYWLMSAGPAERGLRDALDAARDGGR